LGRQDREAEETVGFDVEAVEVWDVSKAKKVKREER